MSSTVNTMSRKTTAFPGWMHVALWIAGALALSLFVIIYGAYGDPQAPQSQKDEVPFLAVTAAVGAVVLFGVIARFAIRSSHSERWALGFAIVGLASLPIFWSGAPILLGTGALVTGRSARPSRMAAAAVIIGCLAAVAAVAVTIVGNTLH
jgi:hypothetical protein